MNKSNLKTYCASPQGFHRGHNLTLLVNGGSKSFLLQVVYDQRIFAGGVGATMDMSVIVKLFKESYSQVIRKNIGFVSIFAYDLGRDLLGSTIK